ncbi:hypothetical protein MLD38_033049 [Melastoma candidum]|uniref:Uncharacterized protein n=1 Tax=Melastoma candidum TaxID=119954 RepID=A0ACB9M5B8_9MYRT|nr:hypothetical protein MLD38_033049 [Melastoma candidum]
MGVVVAVTAEHQVVGGAEGGGGLRGAIVAVLGAVVFSGEEVGEVAVAVAGEAKPGLVGAAGRSGEGSIPGRVVGGGSVFGHYDFTSRISGRISKPTDWGSGERRQKGFGRSF